MKFKIYLGTTKGSIKERVYLTGFSWDCGWYWGGGYIETRNMHTHFDSCFLNTVDIRGHALGNFCTPWNKKEGYTEVRNGCSVWEDLDFFLDDAQFTAKEWWRIKDLYKQFYHFKKAAECFKHGGHCTTDERSESEIVPELANAVNKHIETVIIPKITKALKAGEPNVLLP